MHISECNTCVKQLTRKKHEAIKAMRAFLLFLILSWGSWGRGQGMGAQLPPPARCCHLCGQRWFLPWKVSRLLPVPRGLCYCAAIRFIDLLDAYNIFYWFFMPVILVNCSASSLVEAAKRHISFWNSWSDKLLIAVNGITERLNMRSIFAKRKWRR
jgi:hypothetical protein